MQDNCFLDFIDPELYSHSTKMSQGINDDKKSLQNFTIAIAEKVMECTQKTLSLCSSGCIYKVPECLRKQKESAYTPRIIAIGPLHQKDEHLQTPMRRVKWYYTYHLLNRLTKGIEDDNLKPQKIFEVLQQCAKKMKEKECVDEAKKYYAVEVTVDDEKMSEMMLVDGCFVLELLYASHRDKNSKEAAKMTTNGVDSGINLKALSSIPQPNGGEGSSGVKQLSDPFFDSVFNRYLIKRDLVLLENQIPFFVLEELFKLTVAKIPEDPDRNELSLTDYVLSYFGDIFRSEGTNSEGENSGSKMNTSCGSPSDFAISASGSTKEMEKSEGENSGSKTKTSCPPPSDCVLWVCGSTKESKPTKEEPGKANHYYHILHLLHERYPQPTGGKKVTEFQVSASDLHYAGVKFVSRKENNLFDITFIEPEGICWWFHRAKFEIPTFNIHDATGTFLGNLIALELCSPGVRPHFMSYANFMDTLIDSKEDVKVLKEAKVIRNHLGEDADVAELFNKLCKDVVVGEFYFNDKYHDAYKYSKHWYPNLMAHCKRKYFSPPWAFGAVIVAIIASGMGVTQFVRSFLT